MLGRFIANKRVMISFSDQFLSSTVDKEMLCLSKS